MNHFEAYLEAMKSLGTKTDQIEKIIKEVESGEHGPMALKMVQNLYSDDDNK